MFEIPWFVLVLAYVALAAAGSVFIGRRLKAVRQAQEAIEERSRVIVDEAKERLDTQPKTLRALQDSIESVSVEVEDVRRTSQRALSTARSVQGKLGNQVRHEQENQELPDEPARIRRLPGRSA
jgi:hypothetical protein